MISCRVVTASERGFTLIEVLVALAIVVIGMAAVLGTLTSSASTVLYMKDRTIAQWVALNHIAEQRLSQAGVPAVGNTDGDVDYAGSKWHWRQETVATAVQGMVRMDVMVRPADSKESDDRGWYVTMSGIMGDAVSQPRGDMPLWGSGSMSGTPCQGGQAGQQTQLGQPSLTTPPPGSAGANAAANQNCQPGNGTTSPPAGSPGTPGAAGSTTPAPGATQAPPK